MPIKLLHIALALHILFASLGIKLEKHFCGKELQTVKLFQEKKSCCQKTQHNATSACCHYDLDILDLEKSSQTSNVSFSLEKKTYPLVFIALKPYIEAFLQILFPLFAQIKPNFVLFPPPTLSLSLYLKHLAILI